MPYAADVRARLESDADVVIARYPRSRSALLPLLHLVQSEDGFVSNEGIEFCAEKLGLTTAEVSAVATFYTQYKRKPNGEFTVGVCTNTLCAIMGGDVIFETLEEHLGVRHDETTDDGVVTLEHLECNAACDYAPVVMVNWEFFDNQTPHSAVALVDELRAGKRPMPTRGASLCTFKEVSRVLAGFYDGRAGEGPAAGPATLVGLEHVRELEAAGAHRRREDDTTGARSNGGGTAASAPSAHDASTGTAESDPAHPSAPAGAEDKGEAK
jgi:NADH-quinone oxidoreductase subunit E